MSTVLYFAYGSNLHPVRFRERLPCARLVATASLNQHVLRYHKRGMCGSGKCNAFHTGKMEDRVLGAIYEINLTEKSALDGFEGDGYTWQAVQLTVHGTLHEAFAYVAEASFIDDSLRPYSWYQSLVAQGARFHGFPLSYIEKFISVNSISDPNAARQKRHLKLLARMTSDETTRALGSH